MVLMFVYWDDATIWCSVASGVSWRAKKPSSQNRQYFRDTGIAIYDLSRCRCTRKSTTRAAAPSAKPKGEPALACGHEAQG
jgi:hypothetical protein